MLTGIALIIIGKIIMDLSFAGGVATIVLGSLRLVVEIAGAVITFMRAAANLEDRE